jgi:NodT family efflux transporter outer membrane factor (OMF) lipoprotein
MTTRPGSVRAARCALAAVLLGSCTVGPDWTPDPPAVPAAFDVQPPATDTAAAIVTAADADVAAWWTVFHDPELDALIARATTGNLDLRAAAARVQQARAGRAIVAGGLWPTLNATAGAVRVQSNSPGGLDTVAAAAHTQLQVGLDASWEADLFGGIRRDVEAADADLQAAVEDRRDVMVALAGEVGFDYFALRGLQQRLHVADDNLTAQAHSLDITQRRFADGLASRLDVAQAEALVATTRAAIPALRAAAQQARLELGVLLGQDPASLDAELAAAVPLPQTPATVPIGLPADLLRRRPDVRRSEAQLHAATARIGKATADLWPHLSLAAALGFVHDALPDWLAPGNRAWSAGASLLAPLFAGGSLQAGVARADAAADEALQHYHAAVLVALRDVDGSVEAFLREQERLRALQQAVAADREAVDLASRSYTAGQTDFLVVLDAQRSLLLAEDQQVQSATAVATDLVALFKALGGGWSEHDAVPAAAP